MKLNEIIKKDKKVYFNFYRAGKMYYDIDVEDSIYTFPVPLDDVGDASLFREDKSILFMRYIRKSLEDKTFIKTN